MLKKKAKAVCFPEDILDTRFKPDSSLFCPIHSYKTLHNQHFIYKWTVVLLTQV